MSPQRRPESKVWWKPENWAEEQTLRVVQEVYRLRGSNSARWLAEKTKGLGYEVTRSVIADLENGRRKYISIAEVTALAYALGTAPIALIYPPPYDELIEMLPGMPVPKFVAAEAFCGNSTGGSPIVLAPAPASLTLTGSAPTVTAGGTRALRHARSIGQARNSQRLLLNLLAELQEESDGNQEKYIAPLRAQLETVTDQLKALEAQEDGG